MDLVARLRSAGCVFAEEEAALLRAEASDAETLERWVARRVAGEPLEVVLGWAAFAGLRLNVAPGVFVPRTRTRLLADLAVRHLADRPRPVVVDLCCGTGAVGLLVASRVPDVLLHAVDLDPAAVACARQNLSSVAGTVHLGDLDAPLPDALRGRVDVLLANAPYVPTDAIAAMPPEARDHEARTALDGGTDGLDVLRRVVARAPRWLAPDGVLVVECGEDQVGELAQAVSAAGLQPRAVRAPDLGATALVAAPRPSPVPGPPGT
ncbi:putative protein N(5)-glutamine methyltransferase [Isoptericola sp. b441]|uniref:peptide chain release factor N(5)-glutamine methyltransferase n=1 Tax=Actinotalea lenta TaxID=3064654 RepID=A0ABT9DCP7_9CELL|nr:putative protein N(5)-glutamine methyltransferase [Isoptericola sp. b441]MDO8108084.1 putative protein N(5)-glutamine methyltransferase [Isoptericola sp. b441]